MSTRQFSNQELGDRLQLSSHIREARERSGLLQRELGDRLGVHFSTVAKWESGASPIPRRRISGLERVLGIQLASSVPAGRGAFSVASNAVSAQSGIREQLRQRACVGKWWLGKHAELHDSGLTLPEIDVVREATFEAASTTMNVLQMQLDSCVDAEVEQALTTALQHVLSLWAAMKKAGHRSAA